MLEYGRFLPFLSQAEKGFETDFKMEVRELVRHHSGGVLHAATETDR